MCSNCLPSVCRFSLFASFFFHKVTVDLYLRFLFRTWKSKRDRTCYSSSLTYTLFFFFFFPFFFFFFFFFLSFLSFFSSSSSSSSSSCSFSSSSFSFPLLHFLCFFFPSSASASPSLLSLFLLHLFLHPFLLLLHFSPSFSSFVTWSCTLSTILKLYEKNERTIANSSRFY